MIPRIWLPIKMVVICFVFSDENRREIEREKKRKDQFPIFGNRMKTKNDG